MLPTKVIITLVIITGIGVGTGALVMGLMLSNKYASDPATMTALGSTILAASGAGLIAHLFGGFRDLDHRDP